MPDIGSKCGGKLMLMTLLPWIIGGIAAIGGGILGGISTKKQAEKEQDQIDHQKDMAWDQYELGRDHANEQWELQKGKALDDLALAENRLDQSVDMQIDSFNNNLLAQAYQIQDAQISTESQIGTMEANAGYSGVKGNETTNLLSVYAEENLDRNIDLQNQQNNSSLMGMLDQAGNAWGDIIREEESWGAGGYRTLQKEAQDKYNYDMAKLGETNFNWAIDQAEPGVLDYVTNIFNGASTGLSFGASTYFFANNWGNQSIPNYAKANYGVKSNFRIPGKTYDFAPGSR
jgi:hypothetical protein